MNFLVDNICLLNSSYSKDNIINIFKTILKKSGIKDFILLSSVVQVATTHSIENFEELSFRCGNYQISFKYSLNDVKPSLDKYDMKVIIASFIIAIENSIIYKDLTDKVIFSENKNYPVFNNLVLDISTEIENYKRNGTDFCVAKINVDNILFGEKLNYKIRGYLDELKDVLRNTDSLYRDMKSIYVLFRNSSIEDSSVLLNKIKTVVGECPLGIAQWQSSYVVVDLFSEIDNYIFLNQVNQKSISKKENQMEELDKVLNKSLLKKNNLIIVKRCEVVEPYNLDSSFDFKVNDIVYSVLENTTLPSTPSFVYYFDGVDLAKDIFKLLITKKDN